VSQRGVSPGPEVPAKSPGEAPIRVADVTGVPAKTGIAPGLDGKPSASQPVTPTTKTPQIPAVNVSPSELPTVTPVPSSTPAAPGAAEKTIDSSVARFSDTRIPIERREADIRALAARGDGEAIRILTTLANQDVYLNRAAVEALGAIRDPAVATFLRSKLGDVNTHDVTLLCECIRSAGKVLGDEAVGEIGEVMKAARNRNEGHAVAIRAVCIRTMGELRRVEAVPLLKDELDHMCAQKRLDLAHGSEIVKAYSLIGDKRAGSILTEYADFLEQHKPPEPEPRGYYEEKIKEARDTAWKLTKEA
jgi:hypothetical protein